MKDAPVSRIPLPLAIAPLPDRAAGLLFGAGRGRLLSSTKGMNA
jgi:hypothetical protein